MTWVRLDEGFDEHPKIAQLNDHAFTLFVCGLTYCNRNLTDGFIPRQVGLGKLRWCEGKVAAAIEELVQVGLWLPVDGGWRIHDFLEYQPSKADVEAERAQKQAAGRAGGLAAAIARAKAPATANGVADAHPGATASAQAGALAKSKPVSVSVSVPVNPAPIPVPVASGEATSRAAAREENLDDEPKCIVCRRTGKPLDRLGLCLRCGGTNRG